VTWWETRHRSIGRLFHKTGAEWYKKSVCNFKTRGERRATKGYNNAILNCYNGRKIEYDVESGARRVHLVARYWWVEVKRLVWNLDLNGEIEGASWCHLIGRYLKIRGLGDRKPGKAVVVLRWFSKKVGGRRSKWSYKTLIWWRAGASMWK